MTKAKEMMETQTIWLKLGLLDRLKLWIYSTLETQLLLLLEALRPNLQALWTISLTLLLALDLLLKAKVSLIFWD